MIIHAQNNCFYLKYRFINEKSAYFPNSSVFMIRRLLIELAFAEDPILFRFHRSDIQSPEPNLFKNFAVIPIFTMNISIRKLTGRITKLIKITDFSTKSPGPRTGPSVKKKSGHSWQFFIDPVREREPPTSKDKKRNTPPEIEEQNFPAYTSNLAIKWQRATL